MSKRVYIKPKQGLVVRDPATFKRLPEEGGWVTWNSYWTRRLNDKDVVEAKPPAKPAKAKPARADTAASEEK